MSAHVERVITSGTFSLDGGTWDVDNNVWIVGDDNEVVVVDAAHDAGAIAAAVDGRTVTAIVLTHGHDDHIDAALELAALVAAPTWISSADRMLWDAVHDVAPDHDLVDGTELTVAGVTLSAMSTPGHSPGGTCLYAPALSTVFSGDTLFQGGPGATGRSFSDFGTIIESIRTRLLTLPGSTAVLTGHGDPTTIGDESTHLDEWIARGH